VYDLCFTSFCEEKDCCNVGGCILNGPTTTAEPHRWFLGKHLSAFGSAQLCTLLVDTWAIPYCTIDTKLAAGIGATVVVACLDTLHCT